MNIEAIEASIEAGARYEYSRSGGPGGQHLNRTDSRVRLRVAAEAIAGLSQAERQRMLALLAGRIDADGCLYLVVESERSQLTNKRLAVQRLLAMVVRAARLPKHRVPTKPGRAARERRLQTKKRHAMKKQDRGRPEP